MSGTGGGHEVHLTGHVAEAQLLPSTTERPLRTLDLASLASPVLPPWLDSTNPPLILPFADATFSYALIGHDVLRQVELCGFFDEIRRVLHSAGTVKVLLQGDPERGADSALLNQVLVELSERFFLRNVALDADWLRIEASPKRDADPVASARLTSIATAGVLARQVAAARAQHRAETVRLREMQQRTDDLDAELDAARTEVEQITKLLVAVQTEATTTRRKLQEIEEDANKKSRLAQDEAQQLQAELKRAAEQLRQLRWRLKVMQTRKASRIAEQIKQLKQPWRLPQALYQAARIAIGPSTVVTGSSGGGKQSPKQQQTVAPSTNQVRRPNFHPVEYPTTAPKRPDLLVATILDEFSELAFKYEFDVMPVPRDGWKDLLNQRQPDLLLVESAWNGNGGAWKYAFTGDEVPKVWMLELLDYCREQRIPTVFWNKEDPLEYDTFLRGARHFDWVFTVDANCVERYREDLGHDRIGVLPFAVQPEIHHPIGAFNAREGNVAFAGTYYSTKYPERKEQIDYLLKPTADLGLDIFSRWESNPRYAFPEDLKGNVVGSLDYAQTLTAYRRYKVFLNVNSVIDSPTMFSRRVLELLACGTAVVTGPSPGMAAMLGAGVVDESTDSGTSRMKVRALLQSQELRDRKAVLGIRSVMSGNTYSDRVNHLLKTLGLPVAAGRKRVSILAPTNRPAGYEQILANVGRQRHKDVELIIGLHGIEVDTDRIHALAQEQGIIDLKIQQLPAEWSLGHVLNELSLSASGDYIAKIDDDDLYGANYLSDQLLAFNYTKADIVGKWTRFIYLEQVPCLGVIFPGKEHSYTKLVGGGTILAKRHVFENVSFADRSTGEDTQFLEDCWQSGFKTYSTDRFNHVYMRYSDDSQHTYRPHELQHLSNTRIVSFGTSLDHALVEQ